ncbi:hypothetical protein CWI39_0410p0010 [Hamiltosporidium magnivora]|uniref:Uncharacterized protein n=1 Tax=Hamiltosporidium magnivora TaxID=148818 RepID=A0A4Q9LIN1_9MICR|nr:hypothetical protein CWI39_0410p0010 [Hamiltosporidium magnivora]
MTKICYINLIFINRLFFINGSNDSKSFKSDDYRAYEYAYNTGMERYVKLPEIHISIPKNTPEKYTFIEQKNIKRLILPKIYNDTKIKENILLYHSVEENIYKLMEKYKYLRDNIQNTTANFFTTHSKYYNRSWELLYRIRRRIKLIVKFHKGTNENYNLKQLEICNAMIDSCYINMNILEQTFLKLSR